MSPRSTGGGTRKSCEFSASQTRHENTSSGAKHGVLWAMVVASSWPSFTVPLAQFQLYPSSIRFGPSTCARYRHPLLLGGAGHPASSAVRCWWWWWLLVWVGGDARPTVHNQPTGSCAASLARINRHSRDHPWTDAVSTPQAPPPPIQLHCFLVHIYFPALLLSLLPPPSVLHPPLPPSAVFYPRGSSVFCFVLSLRFSGTGGWPARYSLSLITTPGKCRLDWQTCSLG